MQELEKILEEIDEIKVGFDTECRSECDLYDWSCGACVGECDEYIKERAKDIIRKHMNDGWIPVEHGLPEVFGKYWATIRYDDGRISEPIVVDFRGVQEKYVVDTPNGREYETWGIDSAFHGSRVIAWRPYYIPEPYRPERRECHERK